MVDIPRPAAARRKTIKRLIYVVVFLGVVSAATLGLSKLKPAVPSVDRTKLWMDTVRHGPMLRDVRGLGTLAPEDVRWIPATREGIVERIDLKIGDNVKPETIVLVLINRELEQSFVDADLQVRAAEAELANTRAQLQNQLINQQMNL